MITLRLDRDIVEAFRQSGPGWQGRINDLLRATLSKRSASGSPGQR